jgi:hypothetical protein
VINIRTILTPGIALALFLVLALSTGAGIDAQEPNKAAVVVRLDDDQVASSCVSFSEESLSGMDLLRRSGLAIETKVEGMGSLVCSIENTGCPADDCFCQCSGGSECVYWSYWRNQEEGWAYARVGATQNQIGHGAIDGWSWGPGSLTEAIEPPPVTFDEVCSQDNVSVIAVPPETTEAPEWQPYAVFGAVLLLLGGGVVLSRRRRSA